LGFPFLLEYPAGRWARFPPPLAANAYTIRGSSSKELTMPLKKPHQKVIDQMHFEFVGELGKVLKSDEFDDFRVIYAISNPEKTEIVYIGDTEQGRDVRGRLKSHMKDRDKVGLVEEDSDVYIHVMITEYYVLSHFEDEIGSLPVLNKRKSQKHV
jgi:hypothetical protein